MAIPPVHGSSTTYADTSSSTRNALVPSCSTDVHELSATYADTSSASTSSVTPPGPLTLSEGGPDLLTGSYPIWSPAVYSTHPLSYDKIPQALAHDPALLSLTALDLTGVARGDYVMEIATALKVNSTLTSLNLSHNILRARESTAVAQALRVNSTLRSLDFGHNCLGRHWDSIAAMGQALADNATLISLNLSGNFFNDPGAIDLRIGPIAQALAANTSLTSLDFASSYLNAADGVALAQALTVNPTLTSLNLRSNYFGLDGTVAMAQAIRVNSTLRFLDFGSSGGGGEAGFNAITQALSVNSTLTSIDLSGFGPFFNAGDAASVALAQVLRLNSTLETINLNGSGIGSEGATALAQALMVNSTLRSLSLTGNSLRAAGGAAIGHALTINSTLTSLNLRFNQLAEVGAIAEALRVNSGLKSLNLQDNGLREAGITVIAQALIANATLTDLNLSSNLSRWEQGAIEPVEIRSSRVGAAIIQAFDTNFTLTSLTLWGNEIPYPMVLEIESLLDRNIENREKQGMSLQALCARALVQISFVQLPDENRNIVYHKIWIAFGAPGGDFQFGERNVFRRWSKFVRAVKDSGFDLAKRTIAQFQLAPNEAKSIRQLLA